MDAPTTPRSRRATWREDVLKLVADFQRHAAGEGRESFPPWRIGYIAGLTQVVEDGDAYSVRLHRIVPHLPRPDMRIPKTGRPSTALVDALCWHLDQDVRRYELDHVDQDEPWHRLPSGPLLVDPLFRTALEDARVSETGLCRLVVDANGFGERQEVQLSLGEHTTISWPKVNIRMNEVRVRFKLPGTVDTYWSRGHMVVNVEDMPETIVMAARGRPLSDLVEHEMIARSAVMTVTAITRAPDGTYTIATDAAHGDGLVAAPAATRTAIAA